MRRSIVWYLMFFLFFASSGLFAWNLIIAELFPIVLLTLLAMTISFMSLIEEETEYWARSHSLEVST